MAGSFVTFLAAVSVLGLTGSQVIDRPSSNVLDGRRGCRYEFTASVQDANLVGWFSWSGAQIDRNDTGSNHLYPEIRSDGDAKFARLVVDQAVEVTTWFTLMALKDGASPVQHPFHLAILPGSLPISASVNGGASRTRNISLENYTVRDTIPLECVVEACRSFDQLTLEWIDPEGTVMEEYSGEFTGGQRSFFHNLPVSKAQSGPYQCRVRTSLRQVNYTVVSTLALQGEPASSPPRVGPSSETTSHPPTVTFTTSLPTSGAGHHPRAWHHLPWLCVVAALVCISTCLWH